MKKAIKISSIVYIPLLCIAMFTLLILGIIFAVAANDQELLRELAGEYVNSDGTAASTQEMYALVIGFAIYFFVFLVILIPGLILDIIVLQRASKEDAGLENYSKSSWITFGVLALIFGAEVPGVLSIIWGAMKKDSDPNVQEVHYEEKKEEKPNPSDYDAPDHLN